MKKLTKEDWKRISGKYKHKGKTIVTPRFAHTQHFPFNWQPKPYFAAITKDGIVPHPEPQNPYSTQKIFIATDIPSVQFYRHCRYYRPDNRDANIFETTFKYVDSTTIHFLVEKDDPEIYCIGIWQGCLFVFGKLLRTSTEYKRTRAAMGKLSNYS